MERSGLSSSGDRTVTLDFPACLAADFPDDLPHVVRAVDEVLEAVAISDSFAPLEERSPGLRGNDWSNYLRCSEARMVHAARLVRTLGITAGRVLDYGAYFGNFSLMMRAKGFEVDAIDSFETYRPSLDPILELLQHRGIRTLDFSHAGRELEGLPTASYDVVMCMGVIEHIPHTPRPLLTALAKVLKPGGLLIMDTPNLAQLANRQRLARGEPVMTPIAIQFHAAIPFEGHHREYTADEMAWMIQAAGLDLAALDLFNYSAYVHKTLAGRDAINHWRMVANPTMRELVMVAARKTVADETVVPRDWRELFTDVEAYWRDRLPHGISSENGDAIVGNELLLVDLQEGIAERDRMLAALQADFNKLRAELATVPGTLAETQSTHNAELAEVMDRLGSLQHAFDMTPSERLKRFWKRLTGAAPAEREN
jgi:2-polyprenyl-3-methyl-5-hydroxy-6-metoxy-1,4-benzoquinol methylase